MSKEIAVPVNGIREQVLSTDAEISKVRAKYNRDNSKAKKLYNSLWLDKRKLANFEAGPFLTLFGAFSFIFFFPVLFIEGWIYSLIPLTIFTAIISFPAYVLTKHVRLKIIDRRVDKARTVIDELSESLRELGDMSDIAMVREGNYIGEALIAASKVNPTGHRQLAHRIRKTSKEASKINGTFNSDVQATLAGLAGNLPTSQGGINEAIKRLEELDKKIETVLKEQLVEENNRKNEQEKFTSESESKAINDLFDSFDSLN